MAVKSPIGDTVNGIAAAVRRNRKSADLTQNELAELAGVGKAAVFDIEKGKISVQLDTVLKVLRVLGIEVKLISPVN